MTSFDSVQVFRSNCNDPSEDFSSTKGTPIFATLHQYRTPPKSKDNGANVDRNFGSMGLGGYFSVPDRDVFKFLCQLYDAWFNQKQRLVMAMIPTWDNFNFFCDFDFAFTKLKWNEDNGTTIIKLIERIVFHVSKVVAKFFAHNEFENNDPSIPSEKRTPPQCDYSFLTSPKSEIDKASDVHFRIDINEWTGAGKGYHRYSLFVLNVSPKSGTMDGIEVIKPGLHIYSVGNLRVTRPQAKIISQAIIRELFQEFGSFEELSGIPTFGWLKVIDMSVFKGGLRMMGSARGVDMCSQCCSKDEITQFATAVLNRTSEEERFKNTTFSKSSIQLKSSFKKFDTSSCLLCNGERYILSDRTYEPWMVVNQGEIDHELTDLFAKNKFQAFLSTNFQTHNRTPADLAEFKCPKEYENIQSLQDGEIHPVEEQHGLKKLNLSQCVDKSKEASEGEFYNANSPEALCISKMIREWSFDVNNQGVRFKPWEFISGGLLRRYKYHYMFNLLDGPQGSLVYQSNRRCMRCCPPGKTVRGSEHKRSNWFKITPTRIIQRSFVDNNPECKLTEEEEKIYVSKPLDPTIASLLFPSLLTKAATKKNGANPEIAAQQVKSFPPPKIFSTSLESRLAEQARKDDQFLPQLAKVVAATKKLVERIPETPPNPVATPRHENISKIKDADGHVVEILKMSSFDDLKEKPSDPLHLDIDPEEFSTFVSSQNESHEIAPTVTDILKNAPYKCSSVSKNDPLRKLFTPKMHARARYEFEYVSKAFLLRLKETGDPMYRDILYRQLEGFDATAIDQSLCQTLETAQEISAKKRKGKSQIARNFEKYARNEK